MAGWVRAADDVSDLMEVLHPSKVDRFCDEKDGKEIWHRDVELPAAMLVSTMEELSAWGPVRAPPCAFVCCVLYVPHAACCVLRAASLLPSLPSLPSSPCACHVVIAGDGRFDSWLPLPLTGLATDRCSYT